MLRPLARRSGYVLVGEDVDLAAAQGPAVGGAYHTLLVSQVAGCAHRQVAERLVAGAVGQADDVGPLAALFAQAGDARGERLREHEEGDDHGEGQGGQDGRLAANAEIAEVVLERHLAGDEEGTHGDRGDRQRSGEGQPGGQIVLHAAPTPRGRTPPTAAPNWPSM